MSYSIFTCTNFKSDHSPGVTNITGLCREKDSLSLGVSTSTIADESRSSTNASSSGSGQLRSKNFTKPTGQNPIYRTWDRYNSLGPMYRLLKTLCSRIAITFTTIPKSAVRGQQMIISFLASSIRLPKNAINIFIFVASKD